MKVRRLEATPKPGGQLVRQRRNNLPAAKVRESLGL
jgi:hypothetical protein